jgi:hypothetical protein
MTRILSVVVRLGTSKNSLPNARSSNLLTQQSGYYQVLASTLSPEHNHHAQISIPSLPAAVQPGTPLYI